MSVAINKTKPLLSSSLSEEVLAEHVLPFLDCPSVVTLLSVTRCQYYCPTHGTQLVSDLEIDSLGLGGSEDEEEMETMEEGDDDVDANIEEAGDDKSEKEGVTGTEEDEMETSISNLGEQVKQELLQCEDCEQAKFGRIRCEHCKGFEAEENTIVCDNCNELKGQNCIIGIPVACSLCQKTLCGRWPCMPVLPCSACNVVFCMPCNPFIYCETCGGIDMCLQCAMPASDGGCGICGVCNLHTCGGAYGTFCQSLEYDFGGGAYCPRCVPDDY